MNKGPRNNPLHRTPSTRGLPGQARLLTAPNAFHPICVHPKGCPGRHGSVSQNYRDKHRTTGTNTTPTPSPSCPAGWSWLKPSRGRKQRLGRWEEQMMALQGGSDLFEPSLSR